MENKNLGWIIAGILLIALMIIVGWIINTQAEGKAYNLGRLDGQAEVVDLIWGSGQIPYYDTTGNFTRIRYVSINEVCGQR